MGVEEAMTIFEFFLSIFIPGLLIGNHNLAKEEQPVADIESFVNYNYCPTCGQLIEVENE